MCARSLNVPSRKRRVAVTMKEIERREGQKCSQTDRVTRVVKRRTGKRTSRVDRTN